MATISIGADVPRVSVIVPARNEEACLGACLHSLVAQSMVSFEIIVVDDGSTDRTRDIAASFPGVRIADAGRLAQGWSGKNNAMASGARVARGGWLLFTDADTVHLPGSLARSLAEAQEKGAALLSYSPAQEVHSLLEKMVMPVIFAELASTYRPAEINDASSPAAAANGQYLLISREAYNAVGGHAAVAGSLLEDVALARAVKASGRRIFFRFGGDAVRTRMYRSFSQLCEGWTKNLALLFPSPVKLAFLRRMEFGSIVAGTLAAIIAAFQRQSVTAAILVALVLIVYANFLRRVRKAHFSWDATLLSLFGLPFFSYLLERSKMAYNRGRVSWKGRTYPGETTLSGNQTGWKAIRKSA